jgi:Tol biopolymer transport system component
MRARRTLLIASIACATAPATVANAQVQAPAKPQTQSLDSEAPKGAPPHWLPSEPWVMQHWLPYDERRLYALLEIDRGDVWRWLRDDTRSLADLARLRGRQPEALAAALVAPWRQKLRDPARLATLERRALRTLTQGHLAQHIFFHSLHQEALPTHSPEIFGVASRVEWSTLRRSELSPLQICRLNGLPRSHAQRAAEQRLRRVAAWGVKQQVVPAVQAKRLLARQLSQLPRWLQQTRYNGPPPLVSPRESPATASNYSNNATISHDGRRVGFESYEAKLTIAKTRGEIAVMARRLWSADPRLASPSTGLPVSSYNPAMSADGHWVAFESARGNLNFAKRYGQMAVLVRDLRTGALRRASHPRGTRSRSAYNPTISGDGRLVAFETYQDPQASASRTSVVVRDMRTGALTRVRPPAGAGDASEPRLSADGRRIAFTSLVRSAGRERSEVFVQELGSGRVRRASRSGEEAWEPVLSRDGRTVAYTAARGGGGSVIVVRRLGGRAGAVIAPPAGSGVAFEPSLSADGRRVAFVARAGGVRSTQVFVRDIDVGGGGARLVSRADGRGGAPAQGSAVHPVLSGDGTKVAFTSDAWNLSAEKCNSARGVFVRDLEQDRTRLASVGDGANRYIGPTKGSSTDGDAFVMMLCA